MKITKLFFLLALLSFMTSCSSDDDDLSSTSPLAGEWKLTDLDYSGTTTTTVDNYSFSGTFVGTGYDLETVINFTEDPNEYTTSGNYGINLVSTIEGITSESNVPINGFIGAGTWSYNNGILTATTDQGETNSTPVTIDGNTMEIVWSFERVETPYVGASIVQIVNGVYYFEKQ